MTNTLITGRIYHVVDKTTGEVVKVGSTIKSLNRRFQGQDYQRRYKNHFLLDVRTIESNDADWYEKGNSQSPFLWHLLAIEHLEMIKANTFQKSRLSNQESPLLQKFNGLDGFIGGRLGGIIAGGSKEGRERMSKLGKNISHTERVRRARVAGFKNAENGHCARIAHLGGLVGGLKGGKKNAESGHCARIARLGGLVGGKIGSAKTNHIRWHVKRNKVNSDCEHCKAGI